MQSLAGKEWPQILMRRDEETLLRMVFLTVWRHQKRKQKREERKVCIEVGQVEREEAE